MSTKDEYVQMMHAKLDQLGSEIDTLAAKADRIEGQAREECRIQVESLRAKWDQGRRRLSNIQDSGEGAWEDMKAGLDLAWEALGEALRSARSRFR